MSDPESLITAIDACISEAQEAVNEERIEEIEPMHQRIRQLCEAVAHFTPDEGAQYADELRRILARVEVLEASLIERRDAIGQSLQGLQHYKQAASAYATRVLREPDASAKPDDSSDTP